MTRESRTEEPTEFPLSAVGARFFRSRIIASTETGQLLVDLGDGLEYDILESAASGLTYDVGDEVLVLLDESVGLPRVLVIGRVAHTSVREEKAAALVRPPKRQVMDQKLALVGAPTPTPDTLVIEAREELTLRVGDGSITIRKDGKILIKGKDLVSVAERMNRIKGGAVSIN